MKNEIFYKIAEHAQSISFLQHFPENNYAIAKNEIEKLFNFGIISDPISVMYISFDLEGDTWRTEVPMVCSEYFSKFLYLYFCYTNTLKYRPEDNSEREFRINDLIFLFLPTIKTISIKFEGDEFSVDYEIGMNGDIEGLNIRINPISVKIPNNKIPRNFVNRRSKSLEIISFSEFREKIGDNNNLKEWFKKWTEKDEIVKKRVDLMKVKLVRLFRNFYKLTGNEYWKKVSESEAIECFAKAILFLSFANRWKVNEVEFVVSRDFRRDDNFEISSGGLIIYKGEKTKILKDHLNIYLNLKNRAKTLKQLEIMRNKHALRSAVAAIMGRNMSHNIGSHVLHYLSDPTELDNLWIF